MASRGSENNKSFSERMTDILNFGAINLAMAIGYRTGLFDAMDTFNTPQPVERISGKAGLNPRYVKEWLGVMVTGEIVEASRGEHGENQFYWEKGKSYFL